MKDVNAYLLENDQYYAEIDSVYYNGDKYMLLANENDASDICIRKFTKEDDNEYISLLDDDEFSKVKELLVDKNKALMD